jgi:aminoglycoside 6'-N-acetyltransferase I
MTAKKTLTGDLKKSPARTGIASIRVLNGTDKNEWVRLRHQLWPEHSLDELADDAATFLRSWDGQAYRRSTMPATVLLAELRAGGVIGFAEVDLRPYADGCRSSPVGYLEGWYVAPEHRKRGVGRALMEASEDWARHRGCTEMASDTPLDNSVSQSAHRALGYEEVERLVHFRRPLSERGG